MSIIINALRQGHKELALALIQHSKQYQVCQYDQQGQTALHLAVQKNFIEVVKALLEKGANINALATDPSYTHMTPLHYAALTGNHKAAQLLLTWGANIHLENGQFITAATLAYQHGFMDVARLIEQSQRSSAKYQWPQNRSSKPMLNSTSQKLPGLRNSTLESLEPKQWFNGKAQNMNNVVDFNEYRKNKANKR